MIAVKRFTGGIFSQIISGRDEFAAGALEIKNMIPMLQGPVTRRGGTRYVADASGVVRMEAFVYNEQNAYVVCFKDKEIKIYNPLSKSYITIESPYLAQDVDKLWCYQVQDVMWIAHESYQPRRLTRTDTETFVLNVVDFKNGPYLPQNTTEITLSLSGTNLTASQNLFTSADVGRWVNLKTVANSTTKCCDFKIVSVTNATSAVVGSINGEFHSATPSKLFRMGAFNASLGWPEIITLHQQRLVCVKNKVVYFSKTDSYTDFSIADEGGLVYADNGFRIELAVERGSDIQFCVSMDNLIIGTGSYVYNIRSTSLGEALTPSNATYSRLADKGGCGLQPVIVENGLVFVDVFRRNVYFSVWSSVYEEYSIDDITKFSRFLTNGRIKNVCFCPLPVPLLWFSKKNGGLIGCSFSAAEKVVAWFDADIGGNIISVCSIPNMSEERYDLYLVVEREGYQYLERIGEGLAEEAETSAEGFFVDCGEAFNFSEPVNQVSGLTRFIGKKVQILADGSPQPEQTVSDDGVIFLSPAAKNIVVGFGYDSYVIPSPLRIKENDELKIKRISKVSARLFKSVGMSAGTGTTVKFEEKPFRSTADKMDQEVPLFTGNYEVQTGGFTSENAIIWIGQNQPLPLTVLAVYVDVSVGG